MIQEKKKKLVIISLVLLIHLLITIVLTLDISRQFLPSYCGFFFVQITIYVLSVKNLFVRLKGMEGCLSVCIELLGIVGRLSGYQTQGIMEMG